MATAKIKKGDTVRVIAGRELGKEGKVTSVDVKNHKVLVEGINMADCHVKATRQGQESGIIRKALPMRANKVMVICPKCGKPTRCGYKILEDGSKTRFCSGKRGCGETF